MKLRTIEHQDAPELFACVDRNRAWLRRWLPWLDATTEVAHIQAFIRSVLQGYAENRQLTYVILEDEQIVGICAYNLMDWNLKAGYIGYWLSENQRGKGIMTRAVREVVDYGFTRLGLELCDIKAATSNTASRAVAERLGFTCTGTIRRAENLYGTFVDYAIYSVLKSEWYSQTGQTGGREQQTSGVPCAGEQE